MRLPTLPTCALFSLLALQGCALGGTDARAEGLDPTATPTEWDFLKQTNEARRSEGLAPLRMAPSLVRLARQRATTLASNLEVGPNTALAGYEATAENIGHGVTLEHVQKAFAKSPLHRARLLGDFTYVGVGVASDPDGTVWVTVDLVKSKDAPLAVGETRDDEGAMAALLVHRALL